LKNLAQEAGCRRALGQADIVGELTSMAMQSGQTLQQDQNNRESLVSLQEKTFLNIFQSILDSIMGIFVGLIREPQMKMQIKSPTNIAFFLQVIIFYPGESSKLI